MPSDFMKVKYKIIGVVIIDKDCLLKGETKSWFFGGNTYVERKQIFEMAFDNPIIYAIISSLNY